MYESHFGLKEKPFSIAPDPDYLYMSIRHKEAMAHLSYGVLEAGGFALLTGEVGTGKTTLCRNLLSDLPKSVNLALILNPNINEIELLETICDELKIKYTPAIDLMASPSGGTQKKLLDLINKFLLKAFSKNRHTVLIIDEAQLLSRDVLELVRLLTNLETNKTKLLQIILIGQPELNTMLAREDLRQLSQRVTARYHLRSLDKSEIGEYINYRLTKAGCRQPLFSRQSLNKIYQYTKGTPRLINVLCHHALLNAYSRNRKTVDSATIKKVAREVFPSQQTGLLPLSIDWRKYLPYMLTGAAVLLLLLSAPMVFQSSNIFKANKNEIAQQNIADHNQPKTKQLVPEVASDQPDAIEIKPSLEQEPVAQEQTKTQDVTQPGVASDSTPEQSNRLMDEVLALSKGKLRRIQSVRQMAQLWNVELPDEIFDPLCDEIRKHNLACISLNNNWPGMVVHNRPAVLELNNAEHVLLVELQEDNALIQVGDERYLVNINDLQRHWVGKAMLFWRPTELGDKNFTLGDSSSDVVWLRMTLNQVLNKKNLPVLSSTISSQYDEEMARKISLLQEQNNLKVDGVVGIQTYMLLNETLYPEQIPVLK